MEPWGTPAWLTHNYLVKQRSRHLLRNICIYLATYKKVLHLESVMFLSAVSNAALRSSRTKAEILDASVCNTLIIAFSVVCCGWNPDWKGWSEQERVNFQAKQRSHWCLKKQKAKIDTSQLLFNNRASRFGLLKRALGRCYANSIPWQSLCLCDCPPLCLSVWVSLLVPNHL